MTDPVDFKFTHDHEWVQVRGDIIRVGVSDYIQSKLDDITHVDLPEPDDHHCEMEETLGEIESLRGATEYHAPAAGIITAINTELLVKHELINHDPYGEGWLIEMKLDDMADLDDLMDLHEYEATLPEDEEEE